MMARESLQPFGLQRNAMTIVLGMVVVHRKDSGHTNVPKNQRQQERSWDAIFEMEKNILERDHGMG